MCCQNSDAHENSTADRHEFLPSSSQKATLTVASSKICLSIATILNMPVYGELSVLNIYLCKLRRHTSHVT